MRALGRLALYAGLGLAALTFIYPFLWMVSSTLKPPLEVGTLGLVPEVVTLENYRIMWSRAPFGRALLNSALVAGTITAAVLVLGSMTAYAMARLTFPGALYLALVAALPTILINQTSANFFFGGTSILIVVGVALDTMKQLEAQLMMRNYEGFLK